MSARTISLLVGLVAFLMVAIGKPAWARAQNEIQKLWLATAKALISLAFRLP